MLKDMINIIFFGIGQKTKEKEISGFQAFCVSATSHVGVGNIAGVAIAIIIGGPGAIFWMWLMSFFGCAISFVESTLAQIYKLPKGQKQFYGGHAYYIKNALKNHYLQIILQY